MKHKTFLGFLWNKKQTFFSLLFILIFTCTAIITGIFIGNLPIVGVSILLGFIPFLIWIIDEIKKYQNL